MEKRFEKVYVVSPFKGVDGNYKKNTEYTIECARRVFEQVKIPVVPHLYIPMLMDDSNSAEREIALQMGIELMAGCDAVFVFCKLGLSTGMKGEIKKAKLLGIPTYYFDVPIDNNENNQYHYCPVCSAISIDESWDEATMEYFKDKGIAYVRITNPKMKEVKHCCPKCGFVSNGKDIKMVRLE